MSAIPTDFALLLATIADTHRKRQDLLRAELRLTNHIEAVYRRFTGLTQVERARLTKKASTGLGREACDALHSDAQPDDDDEAGGGQSIAATPVEAAPADLADFLARLDAAERYCVELAEGRRLFARARKPYEKALEKLAKQLPVWAWAEGVRGFGALSLAQIVAECGDLRNYSGPAKVWKRMGLGFAEMADGTFERQRKTTNADLAVALGYSPQRRSLMYVAADNLVKLNDGEFRAYYDAEKARQAEKLPDGPKIAINERAKRHLAKRLLRELWKAWRAEGAMLPTPLLPDHAPTALAAD